ncbi:MAG TPA: hypothetical protein VI408_03980 [Gaiellaceae bacterium]
MIRRKALVLAGFALLAVSGIASAAYGDTLPGLPTTTVALPTVSVPTPTVSVPAPTVSLPVTTQPAPTVPAPVTPPPVHVPTVSAPAVPQQQAPAPPPASAPVPAPMPAPAPVAAAPSATTTAASTTPAPRRVSAVTRAHRSAPRSSARVRARIRARAAAQTARSVRPPARVLHPPTRFEPLVWRRTASVARKEPSVPAGELAALLALAIVGVAGAARSAGLVTQIAETARIALPHVHLRTPLPPTAPSAASPHATATKPRLHAPDVTVRPPGRVAAAQAVITRGGAIRLLEVVVLAMLVGANAILAAVRLHLGRMVAR